MRAGAGERQRKGAVSVKQIRAPIASGSAAQKQSRSANTILLRRNSERRACFVKNAKMHFFLNVFFR